MKNSKYIYFGIVFLIIISSAIAFNKNNQPSNSIIADLTVDFTFNNNNVCSGQSVSFTSIVTGDGPFNYLWNFGDGTSSSTQQNPNHTFQPLGCGNRVFNVTLTVTDVNEVATSKTQSVTVKERPNLTFIDLDTKFGTPFENCNASTIPYTVNVGIDPNSSGCVASYSVAWGDGEVSNNLSLPLSHTYTSQGSFKMMITGNGDNGCRTQQVFTVKNSSNPTGGIVTPGNTVDLCTPISPLEFAISNWGTNPPDTKYELDFGDGTLFTLTQPQLESSAYYNNSNPSASINYPIPHTYTESNCPNNSYTILLDIITSCGTSNLTVGPITILEKPKVSFTARDSACIKQSISLNNTSSSGFNKNCVTGAAWFWDMGDGTTYNTFEPNHIYSAPGTYTISLYAENYCGNTTPVTRIICIEAPVIPEFTATQIEGCAPFSTILNNLTNEVDQCNVATYNWAVNYKSDFCGTKSDYKFINGTNHNSEKPEIEFVSPGIYELVLRGTNSCGTTESAPQQIIVKAPPVVSINAIPDFCDSSVIVKPTATVSSCGPTNATYNWSLSGGVSPTDWEFINGTNQNSVLPEIQFFTPNTYVLSLDISTDCGTTTDIEEFIISPVPEITNTIFNQNLCSGTMTSEIIFESNDPKTKYEWSGLSSTGNISGTIPSGSTNNIPAHLLTLNSGTTGTVIYTVTPYLVNDCPGDPIKFTITVNEGPSIITQPLAATYCIDGVSNALSFTMSGSATGTATYQWYYNNSGNNDPANPATTAVASPEGTQADYQPPTDALGTIYYFAVVGFSGAGSCSEISTSPVAVTITPNVSISNETSLNQTICSGANPSQLNATITGGAGAMSYKWFLSNDAAIDSSDTPVGTNSTSFDPPVLTIPGTYYYYVTVDVDESLGCSDVSSAIFTIEVIEDPKVEITPINQAICTNVSADVLVAEVTGGIDVTNDGLIDNDDYQFQWYLNGMAVREINDSDGDLSTFNHDSSLPAGVYNYYCVISQPNNLHCGGTSNTVTITVNEGPSILTQPVGATYCLEGVSNALSFTMSGSATGTATYQWYYNDLGNNDPSSPTSTAVASPEGTQADYEPPTDALGTIYYFAVVSFSGAGSCSEISTSPVAVTITPNVAISNETPLTQTICSGATPSQLSVMITGGAGAMSYKWFLSDDAVIDSTDTPIGTNSTSFDPPVLAIPGIYYYYVTVDVDENLGCSDVSSEIFRIEVVEDPKVEITPINQAICTNVSAEVLVAEVTGGIDITNDGIINNDDYQFQWYLNGMPVTEVNDSDGDVSTFNHDSTLPAGVYNYYCVISQPNNLHCDSVSNTVTITVNEGPSITSQPIGAEYCLGDTMAELEVVITNGVGVPDYQWYVNNTNDTDTPNPIGTNSSTLIIPNSSVSLFYYYCIITFSEGGCDELATQIVPVTINQVPEISGLSELICSNNPFTVVPDNTNGNIVPLNTTYTWSVPSVNPVGAITGGAEQLVPLTTISQFLENTTLNPATITYKVTPKSGDCVGDTFEIVVTVNPSISVTANAINNACFESNNASIAITISGGVPFGGVMPYNITWTGPNGFSSNDKDLYNLEIGTYVVNIVDDGGCPYSETFEITEPEDLVFSTINFDQETISCFGANDGAIDIYIRGGTLPYIYNWTKDGVPFSNSEDLSDLGSGIYEVLVTDANNCGPITETFTVVEPPELLISLDSQTNVLCYGDATGAITISVAGGRLAYTYSWTGPKGFTSSNQNIYNLISGTYTLTVTDNSGCVKVRDFNVSENDEIAMAVTSTEIKCYGDNDASITIDNIVGGVGPYTIAWSNYGTGMVQNNLSAGIYTITITDAINCVKSFPVEIEEAPLFLIEPVVTQMSCAGENDARIVLNFKGGIAPITVDWDDDATAGVERNNLAPGTYSVTITDGTPCVIQESFTIYNILPLQVSANVTDALDCDDANSGAINLLVSGGTLPYKVVWSNGAITEDLVNIPSSIYNVTVTDANGCVIKGSWNVNRFEPLMVRVDTKSDVDCEAKTVSQTFVAVASGGVPPFQFNWSSGSTSGSNNQVMNTTENGLVILEVTDSLGCSTKYSLNVQTPILGDPDFETSSFGYNNYGLFAIQDPFQFTNAATGDYVSVLWDFGDGNFSSDDSPTHTYLKVGDYSITQTVTYPFGCVYTYIVTLSVEKGYMLIMPNAFTPNNDGINEFFGPEYIGIKKLKLNIYDTWGSLIYSEYSDDIRGWDGRINNQEAENGNYYYTFTAVTFYGSVIEKKGPFVFIK